MSPSEPLQIEKADDGTHVAHYGDYLLRTAFQPVFRFSGGRLAPIACEALLRVSRGPVPVVTDAFFNALGPEQTAAIEPLLRHLHIRNAGHIPSVQRRLFLNFDPRVLAGQARLDVQLRDLGAELRQAGISPADVVCEITEAEAPSAAALRHFIYELRARGYLVAVDDFGARASRMGRVKSVAPDIVKIDRALVHRLMDTPAGFGTLQLLVNRFRKDGIDTLLEGLESLWQVELAEKAGAAMVQGYMTAAPRTVAPGLTDWLMQFSPGPVEAAAPLARRTGN